MKKILTITVGMVLCSTTVLATNSTFLEKVEAEFVHKGALLWPAHPWAGVGFIILAIYVVMAAMGVSLEGLWDMVGDWVDDLKESLLGRRR